MRRGSYVPQGCDQQGRLRPGIYSHDDKAEKLDPPPSGADVVAFVVCGLVSAAVVVALVRFVVGG
jgi:hypothetical protein